MGRIIGRTAGKYAARQYFSSKARNPNKSESQLARCSWATRYARVEQNLGLGRVETARLAEYCNGREELDTLLSIGRTLVLEIMTTGEYLDVSQTHGCRENHAAKQTTGSTMLEDWADVSGLNKIITSYCDFAMGTLDVEQMCDFSGPSKKDVYLTGRSIVKHLNRGGCPTPETAPLDFLLRWHKISRERIL